MNTVVHKNWVNKTKALNKDQDSFKTNIINKSNMNTSQLRN